MEIIEKLEENIGKKTKKEFLPMQDGEVSKTYADIDDLMEDVGFKPNTCIREGIGKFAEWYKKYYCNNN
jgi:UDP-glucuronate 4-epimerase